MPMTGTIKENHVPKNKYDLQILGMPLFTVLSHTAIEEEAESEELPDRTAVPSGHVKPIEFDITIPEHHIIERLGIAAWFNLVKTGMPGYKLAGTLIKYHLDGSYSHSIQLVGVWPKKVKFDEGEMADEGNLAKMTVTLSVDSILVF